MILRVATIAALVGAALGLVCGVLYAVGGFFVDLFTIGLNWGTLLAFGALVGMPAAFAAIGFAGGLLAGLLVALGRAVVDAARGGPAVPARCFASPREQRLWTWTLLVVAAIYSTLGLAAVLAEMLPHGVIVAVFLLSMALVAATVLTQGLRVRPGGVELGVALGIAVVYLMVFLRSSMAERSHLIEFGVVAVFIYEALTERRRQGRRVPAPPVLAIVATALIGAVDELIQWFLPSRVFDPVDILFNLMAAAMAVTAMVALGWARRLLSSPSAGADV